MAWDTETQKTFDDLLAALVDGSLSDESRQLLGIYSWERRGGMYFEVVYSF